jgi:hypothetical protein
MAPHEPPPRASGSDAPSSWDAGFAASARFRRPWLRSAFCVLSGCPSGRHSTRGLASAAILRTPEEPAIGPEGFRRAAGWQLVRCRLCKVCSARLHQGTPVVVSPPPEEAECDRNAEPFTPVNRHPTVGFRLSLAAFYGFQAFDVRTPDGRRWLSLSFVASTPTDL